MNLSEKISSNIEAIFFKIDELYDKDRESYYKVYKNFYDICKRYDLVTGKINEQKTYKLTEVVNLEVDTLLDIHSELVNFIKNNKETLNIQINI